MFWSWKDCALSQTAPPAMLRVFGVLWMHLCPTAVLVPKLPGCISCQQPITGSRTTDVTLSWGHSGLEMQTALGKASFVIYPRSLMVPCSTQKPGWCLWLGGVVWGQKTTPGTQMPGVRYWPCCFLMCHPRWISKGLILKLQHPWDDGSTYPKELLEGEMKYSCLASWGCLANIGCNVSSNRNGEWSGQEGGAWPALQLNKN